MIEMMAYGLNVMKNAVMKWKWNQMECWKMTDEQLDEWRKV